MRDLIRGLFIKVSYIRSRYREVVVVVVLCQEEVEFGVVPLENHGILKAPRRRIARVNIGEPVAGALVTRIIIIIAERARRPYWRSLERITRFMS